MKRLSLAAWMALSAALQTALWVPGAQAQVDPDLVQPKPERRRALPPPPPPRADEQSPKPFFEKETPTARPELVEIGPDFGLWIQPAQGSSVDYGPGFGWGIHARLELNSWLGVRPFFQLIERQVTLEPGAFGMAGVEFEQPALRTLILGGKLEPTWQVSARFRAWLGLGVAWGRSVAPEPTALGNTVIRSAERTGVLLEYAGSVGARWEMVPRLLAVSLAFSAGALDSQSGTLFQPVQAFDPAGHRSHLRELPEFGSSFSTLLGVGWIP